MSFVCLRYPHWPTDAGSSSACAAPPDGNQTTHLAALLTITPHVMVDARGMIWMDARGFDAVDLASRAIDMAQRYGTTAPRVGAARTAIAAQVAAVYSPTAFTIVPVGTDASFLAPFPLAVLDPSAELMPALTSVGLDTCGDLAHLTHEAVEVRFGREGIGLWRLARAEDPRWIFTPVSRTLPSASLAWEEYVLRDTEQLLFVANRLMATICTELQSWGEAARALTLRLTLANSTVVERSLRTARETASRTVWMRLVRFELDRLRLWDGVTGLSVQVDAVGSPVATQGDIFDRGFQTARAVDDALGRLADDGSATLVEPVISSHPLPERRVQWQARAPRDVLPNTSMKSGTPRLVLQLFPEPPRVEVVTAEQQGHRVPVRFRPPEQHATELLTAIGPDQLSGGAETGTPYAREYFTCLTRNGLLVLLFRDALTETWHLQGWWD